jgi:hypothetical protein
MTEENTPTIPLLPEKKDWQLTLWDSFVRIKDRVCITLRWGTVLWLLYSFFLVALGVGIGSYGKTSATLYGAQWVQDHNITVQWEKMNVPFCVEKGAYYQVKRASAWTFSIDGSNKKQNQPHTIRDNE